LLPITAATFEMCEKLDDRYTHLTTELFTGILPFHLLGSEKNSAFSEDFSFFFHPTF